jgi:carotenoid 1,2-hydratase
LRAVPASGYAWWYFDAVSDDGANACTLIAFIGSVFSPYYAWARRRGTAPAENFCAMNMALYRPGGGRWAMTERGAGRLQRAEDGVGIGPSFLRTTESGFVAEINEICAPLPRRLRGQISVQFEAVQDQQFTLAPGHVWRPIAPRCRVELRFENPSVNWSGHGYFDTNFGARPLEADFSSWSWSRGADGRIFYDWQRRDGVLDALALQVGADGGLKEIAAPAMQDLPGTFWRMKRAARGAWEVARTLEDAPFYARTLLRGADGMAVHEALDLHRFSSPIVQAMLPFRMPRF